MMQRMLSLLEQCVLYNRADYNPFATQTSSSSTSLAPDIKSDINLLSSNTSRNGDLYNGSLSSLFSIDLDFGTPIPEAQSVFKAITPLARSTSRRTGHWKLRCRCRCYSCKDFIRIRKGNRSKSPVRTVRPCGAPQSCTRYDFLLLPREVRDLIYTCIFEESSIYVVQKPFSIHKIDVNPAIRYTCKQIYAETIDLLWKSLSVTMNFVGLKSMVGDSLTPLINQLPRGIRPKLRYLTIITPRLVGTTISFGNSWIREMPDIQCLTVTEQLEQCHSREDIDSSVESAIQHVKSLAANTEATRTSWLQTLIDREDRSFSVIYEQEIWGIVVENRKAHMGYLKRDQYWNVIVASSLTDGSATVSKTELTPTQFRRRVQPFNRIDKDGARLEPTSYVHSAQRRLECMLYHEQLDRLEAGTSN